MAPLLAGPGYLPEGLPELRARIADRYVARGLPTRPDQIVVTSGAVAALNVVLRTVLTTGDRVVCESPTYPGAVDAIQRAGGRGVSVAADRRRLGPGSAGGGAAPVGAAAGVPDARLPQPDRTR